VLTPNSAPLPVPAGPSELEQPPKGRAAKSQPAPSASDSPVDNSGGRSPTRGTLGYGLFGDGCCLAVPVAESSVIVRLVARGGVQGCLLR